MGIRDSGSRIRDQGFVLALAAALLFSALGQRQEPFMPVGVRIDSRTALASHELENLRSLRFNIVEFPNQSGSRSIATISQLLGEPQPHVVAVPQPAILPVPTNATGADVRLLAWQSVANGARAVIFSDWTALKDNAATRRAASDFADNLTRNAALYVPLLPRTGPPLVRVERGRGVTATFLESADALVLIATNPSGSEQRATFTFAPEIPEAIWQNMESGAAVNFVVSGEGPYYERTFPPKDVLVLMIRKKWK
jgi:hypothetical protein